jgi:hypothetical protein
MKISQKQDKQSVTQSFFSKNSISFLIDNPLLLIYIYEFLKTFYAGVAKPGQRREI